MIVVDSSAIVSSVAPNDPNHRRAKAVFAQTRDRFVVPLGIMSELAYLIETRFGD